MPTYRRICKFTVLIHLLALIVLYKNNLYTFSILTLLHESEFLAHKTRMHGNRKAIIQAKSSQANADFIFNVALWFFYYCTCNLA